MKPCLLLFALLAFPAAARPWNGIEVGTNTRDDVVKKFGEPTKVVPSETQEVLAYMGKQSIRGTTQVQFRIDGGSKKVVRIDIFPGPVIDKETIENTYGPACPAGETPPEACYVRKLTEDFRTYLNYPTLGLAIFLNEDGKTVQSFVYQPPRPAKQ
jgi:hypothetical protein